MILWFRGWSSNSLCFCRLCVSSYSLPSRDTIKEPFGTFITRDGDKITLFYLYNAHVSLPSQITCTTQGWLYQYLVLPWFLLFSWELHQCPLSGQEMRTPKSHLQPALLFTLLVKSLLHSEKENLQGTHQKHLKCNQPSAKYLTWISWLKNLCCRIRAGFQLQ